MIEPKLKVYVASALLTLFEFLFSAEWIFSRSYVERSPEIDGIVQSFPLYYNLDSHYKQQCVFDDKKKKSNNQLSRN